MQEIEQALQKAFAADVYKCVMSKPADSQCLYKKIECNRLDGRYQLTKYTDTQVFHENLSVQETMDTIQKLLGATYRNLNTWSQGYTCSIQISKKGKVLFRQTQVQQAPNMQLTHNREKNYILKQGLLIEPLVDMGVLTKDGKVVHAMYDKYKQINRFIEIIDDEVKRSKQKEFTIVDFGCGKSYLTFVLYYYFTAIKQMQVHMVGLDLKQDVIEKCNLAAKKYGYENLVFQVGDISQYKDERHIDMVITLHACDTATDFALYHAVQWDAGLIFSVPCCQHELNQQIESEKLALFTRYGIVKERLSALLTDSIRCNLLECCGYQAQMVEFIDLDHTPKNIMIRAKKKPHLDRAARLQEVEAVMEEFHLRPTLYTLLKDARRI